MPVDYKCFENLEDLVEFLNQVDIEKFLLNFQIVRDGDKICVVYQYRG